MVNDRKVTAMELLSGLESQVTDEEIRHIVDALGLLSGKEEKLVETADGSVLRYICLELLFNTPTPGEAENNRVRETAFGIGG